MTANPHKVLSPLAAYRRSLDQKARLAAGFAWRIERLHAALRREGIAAVSQRTGIRGERRLAAAAAFAAAAPGRASLAQAYRDVAIRFGTRLVDPAEAGFARGLRLFHRNYVANFPLPEEQETRAGFRKLWREGAAGKTAGGYQELGFSTVCPLTGRYLMGVNFTVQPRSGSTHFIYGFVTPAARGLGGFSNALLGLMRSEARARMREHHERQPEDRPAFAWDGEPLVLFEKNVIGAMTLPDILMDSARIGLRNPPGPTRRLATGSISQNLRDCIWDRRGAWIVDYAYVQSSLDGVTEVPDADAARVIALLAGGATDPAAEAALERSLAGKVEGCRTLQLCAFVGTDTRAVPTKQIREHNRIFQGTSVTKEPARIEQDIYFRAQCASLDARAHAGVVALQPVAPFGDGVADFDGAEQLLQALLARVGWDDLRAYPTRTYAEWLANARGEPSGSVLAIG